MKIALVTPYQYPYPGGVTEHVSHLDHCFREWGHEVKIIAPCPEDATDIPDNVIRMGSHITPIGFGGSISRITLSPRIYRPVKKLLKAENFDIIHLHEPLMPALPLFVLRHSKTINVGTFHAYRETPHWGLETLRPVFDPFFDKLHAKICVSHAAWDQISRYYPDDYAIIPNGIDVQEFTNPGVLPIEKYVDGRPNILFMGRMEKRKGFRYLMRAFPYIVEAVPDARLIVAGAFEKEDKEPFVRYARMHGLSSVKFVGRVSEEELPRYYKTCDVFCAPSTGFESFGIVLLEAMAAGKPIVASNIRGYRSVMEDGQEGLLVEPENEHAIADAIIRLLQNPTLCQEMGQRGQRKAMRYDWPLVARQVLDVYEELIKLKAEGNLDVE
ncbi:MAG: GDP-mannose-dependent alpha-(1-2)-phosphatidylinositol mannosyltransferase [Chloroflexi bacterium ADurb.Bin180]|nr:MAG: GDP-mannose-dependent alpha-(1-2)-phosphatidylinositol mannosyltransferase [Chloroflexi bacterium ADurb.Bin180]